MNNHIVDTANSQIGSPWLSIIIPVYNAERYLAKCLDSILIQTYKDFEVILIDDGSTDRSSEICQHYSRKDRRFRYIQKENGGAYQARIYGSERAKGTYITFCDADDYYTNKNAFQILYQHMSSDRYDALQFSYEYKYNHLKLKKLCVKAPVSVDRESFLANEYPSLLCSVWAPATITLNIWNKVYHRKLLSNFPSADSAPKIFWGDDLIMNLQLLSSCQSLLFIPNVLYGYRYFSGGTSNFSPSGLTDLNSIKKYQLYYLDRYEGPQIDQMRSLLFQEAASWFYAHIQQALKHMTEEEVAANIAESLQLPSIALTREYYLHESDCKWEAMELLRNADPQEYITKAKVFRQNYPITVDRKSVV